jgi:hypothetical protein
LLAGLRLCVYGDRRNVGCDAHTNFADESVYALPKKFAPSD